jgi:hypothetical protein
VATGVANGSALDHMRDNVRGIFDKHGIAEIRCDAIAGLIWQIRRERAPAERDRKRKREAMISRTIEQMKKIVSEQKKSIEAAIGENGDLATMFNYPNTLIELDRFSDSLQHATHILLPQDDPLDGKDERSQWHRPARFLAQFAIYAVWARLPIPDEVVFKISLVGDLLKLAGINKDLPAIRAVLKKTDRQFLAGLSGSVVSVGQSNVHVVTAR